MKPDEILDAMEHIDAELIEAAGQAPRRSSMPGVIAALAAMLVLVIGIAFLMGKSPNGPLQIGIGPHRATSSTQHVHASGRCPCGWSPFTSASCTRPTTSHTASDYSIIHSAESWYIVFRDETIYSLPNGQQTPATVDFSSVDDFVYSVTNGLLKDWQKEIMVNAFPRDDNGIMICDFNHIYEPVTPSECKLDGVGWAGLNYSFSISVDNDWSGIIHYYTEKQYKSVFTADYVEYFNNQNITITKVETMDNGKVLTHYKTRSGEFMQERYSLTDGEKTFIVDKTYRLSMNNTMIPTSYTVPYNVTLYCTEGNVNYVVDLFDFSETPTDSWLLNFGLSPYSAG